jgi:hypothetical protein
MASGMTCFRTSAGAHTPGERAASAPSPKPPRSRSAIQFRASGRRQPPLPNHHARGRQTNSGRAGGVSPLSQTDHARSRQTNSGRAGGVSPLSQFEFARSRLALGAGTSPLVAIRAGISGHSTRRQSAACWPSFRPSTTNTGMDTRSSRGTASARSKNRDNERSHQHGDGDRECRDDFPKRSRGESCRINTVGPDNQSMTGVHKCQQIASKTREGTSAEIRVSRWIDESHRCTGH